VHDPDRLLPPFTRAAEDFSEVTQVGVDETGQRRGHDYVSVFVDLDRSQVLFATPTREKKVLSEFKTDLEAHGGDAAKVTNFSADLWQPYRYGIKGNFPNAELTIDRYRVLQFLNRSVDEVRRREQRSEPGLRKARYIWLKSRATSAHGSGKTCPIFADVIARLPAPTSRSWSSKISGSSAPPMPPPISRTGALAFTDLTVDHRHGYRSRIVLPCSHHE
jgi:hypothetical protein